MNSELTDPRNDRARELAIGEDWPALLNHAESWLDRQPSAHCPLFYRAHALWGLRRWHEAAIAFKNTKDVEPTWSEPLDHYLEACERRIRQRV